MSRSDSTKLIAGSLIVLAVLYIAYNVDPSLGGLLGRREGFEAPPTTTTVKAPTAPKPVMTQQGATAPTANQGTITAPVATPIAPAPVVTPNTIATNTIAAPAPLETATAVKQGFKNGGSKNAKEGFADLASMEGPAAFASAEAPAGCYPRDQLTPLELLPTDQQTIYAQQNPMGVGSLKGKNFLSAGALIGVNTVGQSLRNANLQLRSEPPNPQVPVSIFYQSTIGPDVSHRPLEVGS